MSARSALHRLRSLLYPLLLAGTVGLAVVGWRAALPVGSALTLALLTLFGILLLLERWLPYAAAWRQGGDTAVDLKHSAAALVVDRLVRAGAEGGLVGLAVYGGAGVLATAPLFAQVVALLVLPDVFKYAVHRLSHRWNPLWGVHAVHHQPDRVVLLNGLRMHPLNVIWNVAPDALLVVLAGPAPLAALIAGGIRGAVSLLQHANVDLRAGWLAPLFSTPEAHRWHHVRDRIASDANYGATFLIWDWLLGTYRAPALHAEPAEMGIDEVLPRSWAGQMLWPLCRERLRTTCFTAKLRAVLQ